MKFKLVYSLGIILLVLSLLFSGCTKEKEATVTPEKTGTFKLAVIVPTSGAAAPWGIPPLRAAEMRAQMINDAGGILVNGTRYKFEIIAYDGKSDITTIQSCLRKAILQDKADAVLIHQMIQETSEIRKENHVLSINLGYQLLAVDPEDPLQFHFITLPEQTSCVVYNYVKEHYNPKRRVGVGPSDFLGQYMQGMGREVCDLLGIPTVHEEWYEAGVLDFATLAARILEYEPDLIGFDGMSPKDGALLVKECRALGYTGLFAEDGSKGNANEFAAIAGLENAEGVIYYGMSEDLYDDAMKAWQDLYIKKYGPPFDPYVIDWCGAVETLAAAIQKAQSVEPDAIAAAIRSPDFKGTAVYGEFYYDFAKVYGIGNQIVAPVPVLQIQADGSPKNVLYARPNDYMKLVEDIGSRARANLLPKLMGK